MKKAGKSIILISEELPELVGMSDRILIMRDGQIAHEALRTVRPAESQLINYNAVTRVGKIKQKLAKLSKTVGCRLCCPSSALP